MRYKFLPALALVAATGWLVRLALEASWAHFVELCPNTDVLSWDANLRMLTVLDQFQDFRSGDWLRALFPLFDAPTWPPLRAVIALVVFGLNPGGPDTLLDVAISFVFYVLVFPSMLIIAFELSRDWLRASVIFFFSAVLMLHTRELPVFSVSAMLETQGMFFMLWTLFYLHKVYERHEYREASVILRERRDLPGKRRFVWGLLIFSQGLFHTKYPYGVMLILALIALEILRNPRQLVDLVLLYLTRHMLGRQWFHYLLNALKILALLAFAYAIIQRADIPAKTVRYALYAVVLVFFIDFNVYLIQYRWPLRRLMDGVTRHVYLAVILPAAVWMLLQPDRVSSILGTQQHVQDASRSFFASLGADIFDDSRPFLIFLACALLALGVLGFQALRRRFSFAAANPSEEATFEDQVNAGATSARGPKYVGPTEILERVEALGRPLMAVTVALLLQFVILEILTGNKQLRHIYHLIPAILILIGAWVMRLPRLIPGGKDAPQAFARLRRISVALALILPIFGVLPLLVRSGGLLAGPPSEEYLASRPMCFTGPKRENFEPVRWFTLRVDPDRRYIFRNSFHELNTPQYARVLASEFDLLFRLRTFDSGTVRNDSRFQWSDWSDFDHLLLLTTSCVDPVQDALLKQRTEKLGVRLTPTARHIYQHPKGPLCLREYRLRK